MSAGNTNVKNDNNVFFWQTKTAYASASRRLMRESRTNIWQRFLQRKKWSDAILQRKCRKLDILLSSFMIMFPKYFSVLGKCLFGMANW